MAFVDVLIISDSKSVGGFKVKQTLFEFANYEEYSQNNCHGTEKFF